MKSSSLLPSSLLGMLLFCMVSCGGPSDKKDKESTEAAATDTTTAAPAPAPAPAPVSTIVTTPVTMMIVEHKVADYDKFLVAYEGHDSMRLANGIHSYVIGRGINDPNMLMVVTKVDDIAKAKAFSKSPDLKKAMQKAGVTGAPSISIVTSTWQDTSNIGDVIRSRTTYMVKDWDTWVKKFDSTKQIRMDNGLADRVIGHDADNDKKVSIVVAVMDTAKAYAFWKSDQLKQLRKNSGATTEPKRFLFRVAKRY